MRRRSLLFALAACLSAFSAWVAAPAISLTPYLPPARDFEQSVPEVLTLPHGKPADFRTSTAEAPHEFDLVGIGGELREVEIRTRNSESGEWSEWVEVEGGDPLYAPGSDAAQVRSEGFRPVGELHYVNVSGTGGGIGERLVSGARAAINSAYITAARSGPVNLLSPAIAEAARPPVPTFVSRLGWGAENSVGGCPPRSGPAYGATNAVAVHHTVSTVDYAPEEAPGIVLGICRYHVNGNGWNDIGYNALVDRFGILYEGRAGGLQLPVVGAHTEGYNNSASAIASIGNHVSAPMSPEAQNSLVRYLAWRLVSAGQPPGGFTTLLSTGGSTNRYPVGTPVTVERIFGHGTTNVTECPGTYLSAILPDIRRRTQALVKRYARGKKEKKKKRKGKGKKRGQKGKKKPKKPKKPGKR